MVKLLIRILLRPLLLAVLLICLGGFLLFQGMKPVKDFDALDTFNGRIDAIYEKKVRKYSSTYAYKISVNSSTEGVKSFSISARDISREKIAQLNGEFVEIKYDGSRVYYLKSENLYRASPGETILIKYEDEKFEVELGREKDARYGKQISTVGGLLLLIVIFLKLVSRRKANLDSVS